MSSSQKQILPLLGTIAIWLGMLTSVTAQTQVSASVFNNAIALPGGAFLSPVHLGIDVGLTFGYKEHPRHERFIHTKLGLYNQRLIHTGVQVYGEYTYRYRPGRRLGIDGALGLGALTTVLDTELFRQNENGVYEAASKTRLHAQVSAALGLTYGQRNSRFQPFVQYRFRLFTPFVHAYVPVAPSTSLHFGTFYRINR